ncbi:NADP-dependent oxidoreductase domain-containing protein [Roridomyces roridus]|uniref:NADP-dependent oxidoreductase domain-containing protein n=1 Tax=Roridomyces roridus TaxID=1738132 RepID=A0AAD7FT49_9AGAR|nr:NADP-dependent oxidoreductase domain-containing protein [Roridomyces roridus]
MSAILPTRKIGTADEPLFTAMGFGTMGLAMSYGPVESDEERFKFKRNPGKREGVFLATKFGAYFDEQHTATLRSDPEFVREQIASSLERLGVDHIDLYYQHRVDPKTPIEVTVRAMAELVKEGKVKYLGLSECSAKALRRAHAVHPISAIQIEYSPFALYIEDPQVALLQTARELGVTVVAYSPIGHGLLTGQYKSPADFDPTDIRRVLPKFSESNFPKILSIVDRVKVIAENYGATPAQATLAWVLAQGPDFVIIPGTKKVKYLEENVKAATITLTEEDINAVRELAEEAERDLPKHRVPEGHDMGMGEDSPELEMN